LRRKKRLGPLDPQQLPSKKPRLASLLKTDKASVQPVNPFEEVLIDEFCTGASSATRDKLAPVLRSAHKDFLEFKRAEKLQCSQPRFTPARLNRKLQSSFPGLQSKAMAGKFLSLWLEHRAIQFASREGASEDDKTMCVCISTYCSIIRLMGAGKHILSEQEAKLFKELVLRHLHAWVYMHTRGLKLPKGRPGKRTYQLLPKLHHLWHLAFDTESTRLNPVNTH
ncbi:Uncharacterized protein (Fragment), partial [Durusdinium trenchii]